MNLLTNIKGKKLIIFGTGNFCGKIMNKYKFPVEYFVDNNNTKWGKHFCKRVIENPKRLQDEHEDDIRIIVASEYFSQISEQLKKMEFEENVHFFNGIDLLVNEANKWEQIITKMKCLIGKYKLLVKIYYFINGKFDREMVGTYSGVLENNINDFRRDIHRIEKGLVNKNKKELFALDYINKTVKKYINIINESAIDETVKRWAFDVLYKYFDTVRLTYNLFQLKNEFLNVSERFLIDDGEKHIPYKREKNETTINFDDLYRLSQFRRSVRYFSDTPVPREVIDNGVKVALQSPSACNRQPFKFRIFDDPQLLKEIKKLPLGIKGFEESIPVLAVVIGDLSSYFDERDRHLIYIDSSLAVMSFIYALEAQGLSSCILNWADIEEREKKIQNIMGLGSYERPIMMIALGYPDYDSLVAYSAKKEIREVRSYNNE